MSKKLKRKTVNLKPHQDAFIKRKAAELKRLVPPGDEDLVTESGVIQGLIDFWMAYDARRKPAADSRIRE
jgi:hypothetical protein